MNRKQPNPIKDRLYLLLFAGLLLAVASYGAGWLYQQPLHPVAALGYEPPLMLPINGSQPVLALTPLSPAIGSAPLSPANAAKLPLLVPMSQQPVPPSAASCTTVTLPGCARQPAVPPDATTESITILLLGSDSRLGSLISRTDTIMLFSLHKQRQTISLLSIPRDLYVEIPGYGRDRINTAVPHGAAGGQPAAGVNLAMQTVEQALGVAVDHYILVDFQAVIQMIDALGGLEFTTPYTIDDPTFPDISGGYDPLFIPAGTHHFDGEMALKYIRTRHQDNDFYRAQRQQQLLLALRQHVLSLGLAQLVGRAPALYRQVQQGVFTDLSLEELVTLAQWGSHVPAENIKTAVLDGKYVAGHRTAAGEHVLLLQPEKAAILVQEMFHSRRDTNNTPHIIKIVVTRPPPQSQTNK